MSDFCEYHYSQECDCSRGCLSPLKAFIDYMNNTPEEELQQTIDEINKMGIQGPTVEEYFDALNGHPRKIAGLQERYELSLARISELEKEVDELKATLEEYRRYIKW